MQHEWQKFVECNFLRVDYTARITQALEVWIDPARREVILCQRQSRLNRVKAALQPCAAGFQRLQTDDLGFNVRLPDVREPVPCFLMFMLVSRIHTEKGHETREHDRVFVRRREMVDRPVLSAQNCSGYDQNAARDEIYGNDFKRPISHRPAFNALTAH